MIIAYLLRPAPDHVPYNAGSFSHEPREKTEFNDREILQRVLEDLEFSLKKKRLQRDELNLENEIMEGERKKEDLKTEVAMKDQIKQPIQLRPFTRGVPKSTSVSPALLAHCIHKPIPCFLCSSVVFLIISSAGCSDLYNTINFFISVSKSYPILSPYGISKRCLSQRKNNPPKFLSSRRRTNFVTRPGSVS